MSEVVEAVTHRWKNWANLCNDFSKRIENFFNTHNNLNSWLVVKERMLTVLDPTSSDNGMLQKLQLLVFEEFRSEKPQLSHLQDVGRSILDKFIGTSPENKVISSKLESIQTKWDDLVLRLVDTNKDFDSGLNHLRQTLCNINQSLNALPPDRDHQENLQKLENLDRQLEAERPLLDVSEVVGAALFDLLTDSATRVDVNERLGAVSKLYQTLQKNLVNRKSESEAALRAFQQLGDDSVRILDWLNGKPDNLCSCLLISAHKPTLQHIIDTYEPVYREIMGREIEIITLLSKGKEFRDKSDGITQSNLDKISRQWRKLRCDVIYVQSRLQTSMERCKKYHAAAKSFLTWLATAEDKLALIKSGKFL